MKNSSKKAILRLIRIIWYPYCHTLLLLYDRHKCHKMTFYDIYDGHKMWCHNIKVWQYGYQINRNNLSISVLEEFLNYQHQGKQKDENIFFQDFPFVLPFIKLKWMATWDFQQFWWFINFFGLSMCIHSLGQKLGHGFKKNAKLE